jgi:hypothetical protein
MDDDLSLKIKRQPQCKTTSKKNNPTKTIKLKNNGCGTAPGNPVHSISALYTNF